MHDCIVKLLKSSTDEDALECLCQLLKTIGKEMDTMKNKVCFYMYESNGRYDLLDVYLFYH